MTQNPADLVHALADRVDRAPVPHRVAPYHYVHTSGWYQHTIRTRTVDRSRSEIRSMSTDFFDRQLWVAPDGSGRLLVTQGKTVIRPSGHYPPGSLSGDFLTASDLDTITEQLRQKFPSGSVADPMKSVETVWQGQVVPPVLQRLLLLFLAERHDLVVDGPIVDRLGRSGISLSHVEPVQHIRRRLVFDEKTGMLLASQNITDDGTPEAAAIPTITNCTMWLDTGYSANTDTTPSM